VGRCADSVRVVITVDYVCKVVAGSNPGKTKAVLKCFGWSCRCIGEVSSYRMGGEGVSVVV